MNVFVTTNPRSRIFAMALAAFGTATTGCTHPRETPKSLDHLQPKSTVTRADDNGNRAPVAGTPLPMPCDRQMETEADEWRTELERSRKHELRIIDLDHQESVDRLIHEISSTIVVSDDEIDGLISSTRSKNDQPAIKIRHIFLRADADSTKTQKRFQAAAAKKAFDRALAGENFEELARDVSDSADAPTGGLISLLRPGMADPSFEKVVFSLSEGEISEIIETPSGYHIARLEHRYPIQPFDERAYRASAPQVLKEQKLELIRSKLIKSLRETESYQKHWSTNGGITPRPGDGVILEYKDFTLTIDDLEHARHRFEPALQRLDQRIDYLETILDRELLFHESLKRLQPTAEELENRLLQATETALAEEAVERDMLEAKQQIPQPALAAFAADPASPLEIPERLHTKVIFVSDGNSPFRALMLAEEIHGHLCSGSDFSSLAKQYSDGPNADRGGDIGFLDRIELFKYAGELAQAAGALGIGEVSNPIRITSSRLASAAQTLRGGFLIVKLVDRQPPRRLRVGSDEEEIRERYWEEHRKRFIDVQRDQTLDNPKGTNADQ